MNVSITTQTENDVVFTVGHACEIKATISISKGTNETLISVMNSKAEVLKEQTLKKYDLKEVIFNGRTIELYPTDTKDTPILIKVTHYEYQVKKNELVNEIQITILNGDKKDNTLIEDKAHTTSKKISFETLIEVAQTDVVTTVTLATNRAYLHALFGGVEHKEPITDETEIRKLVANSENENLTEEHYKKAWEMQKTINETLKSCDIVKVIYKG